MKAKTIELGASAERVRKSQRAETYAARVGNLQALMQIVASMAEGFDSHDHNECVHRLNCIRERARRALTRDQQIADGLVGDGHLGGSL